MAARKGGARRKAGRRAGKIRQRRGLVSEHPRNFAAEAAIIETVADVIFRLGNPQRRKRIDSRRKAEIVRRPAHGARHFLAGRNDRVGPVAAAKQRKRLPHILAGNALHAGNRNVFSPHCGEKCLLKRGFSGIERHVRHQADALRAVVQRPGGKRAGRLRHVEPRMRKPFRRAAQREHHAHARLKERCVALLRIGQTGDDQRIPRAGGNHLGNGLVLRSGDVVRQAQKRAVSLFCRLLRERLI